MLKKAILLQKDTLNKGRAKPPCEKHLQHTSLTEISVYAKNSKLTKERGLWARAAKHLKGEGAVGTEPWAPADQWPSGGRVYHYCPLAVCGSVSPAALALKNSCP